MVLPVLAVVMLFCVRTHKISAATIVQSGSCGADDGSNITWTLDDEGCLTLDGTGRQRITEKQSMVRILLLINHGKNIESTLKV